MSYQFNSKEDAETMAELLSFRTGGRYMASMHCMSGRRWGVVRIPPGRLIGGFIWLPAKERFPLPMSKARPLKRELP